MLAFVPMHSFSPKFVPTYGISCRTSMYNDKNTAEEDIAGSDLIIHLGRLKDGGLR